LSTGRKKYARPRLKLLFPAYFFRRSWAGLEIYYRKAIRTPVRPRKKYKTGILLSGIAGNWHTKNQGFQDLQIIHETGISLSPQLKSARI
jgi:hypothetical protein